MLGRAHSRGHLQAQAYLQTEGSLPLAACRHQTVCTGLYLHSAWHHPVHAARVEVSVVGAEWIRTPGRMVALHDIELSVCDAL